MPDAALRRHCRRVRAADSSGHVLEPNLAAAARFLTLLDEEAEAFTFVTFDDNSSERIVASLAS